MAVKKVRLRIQSFFYSREITVMRGNVDFIVRTSGRIHLLLGNSRASGFIGFLAQVFFPENSEGDCPGDEHTSKANTAPKQEVAVDAGPFCRSFARPRFGRQRQ